MADMDEDTIPRTEAAVGEEVDLSDETQDFRFLANFSSSKDASKIPKRGEKDFEPHSTKLQDSSLAASRAAMHNALAYERLHQPKSHVLATYHPETNMAYAYNPKGPLFVKMGQVLPAKQDPFGDDGRRGQRVWLLPEEVLYLVERGTLDVRWPLDPADAADREDGDTEGQEEDFGLPMSLQAAYAMFIGNEESKNGHLTFDRYAVYAGLKRMGYTILRAPSWDGSPQPPGPECLPSAVKPTARPWQPGLLLHSLWTQIFNPPPTSSQINERAKTGPLVPPATYRTYPQLYPHLRLIPSYDPLNPQPLPSPEYPIQITYNIYKPSNPTYRKSAPGPPDFQIAVLDARSTTIPSLQQLDDLMARQPFNPPKEGGQVYGRLRQGWKSVVLAAVDQGVVSYLRLADAGFGGERMYERAAPRGGKGGGGRGRGRGR